MATLRQLYQFCYRDACEFGGLRLWLALRCLPTLLLLQLLLLLLASSPARSAVERVDWDDPEGGQLLLREVGGVYERALIHDSNVHFDISGMVATVRLEQTFRNDSKQFREGIYAFPLPPAAAVRAMEMRVGNRRIIGQIREKREAKKIYQAAKKAGRKASLVEQQRPNLFTNRVANIGPGEELTVVLEYVESVAYESGIFSLRFPMTITPRYMPGTPLLGAGRESIAEPLELNPYFGWAVATDQVPDAPAISPLLAPGSGNDSAPVNAITVTARLDMGMPLSLVTSPYHDIALSRSSGVYSVRLVDSAVEMNRDFVLQWEPLADTAPQAALFTEKIGEEYFGLLMVVPPGRTGALQQITRELIFVVDTSGSMGGVSIEQARASVSRALQQLQPEDRFNIIEFNSSHRALYRTAMPATRHHVQRAQEFVRQLHAAGGTEMLPALQAALLPTAEADMYREGTVLRQVVFITDGAVGNEDALFAQIATLLGDSRLFTVGIGSAPNSWFMRKAAEFGRGAHIHIGDVNEVGRKMASLFEQLSHPAVVDLIVEWPLPVEAWPEKVPDLYYGQPLNVAVSFGAQRPAGDVLVRGSLGATPWRRRLQLPVDPSAGKHAGVGSIWARRKIEGLLDGLVQGEPEQDVRAQVLPVALDHQLMSPYTSFVAVEEIVSRSTEDPLHATPVPNSRPAGQSPQQYAYPRTATTGPAKAWLAMLMLFLAMILRVLRQPENNHAATLAS